MLVAGDVNGLSWISAMKKILHKINQVVMSLIELNTPIVDLLCSPVSLQEEHSKIPIHGDAAFFDTIVVKIGAEFDEVEDVGS